MRTLAPIVLFVYNRLGHTRKTVEALQKNELASDSILYVFSDGVKEKASLEQENRVNEVRDYIHTITGFKQVIVEESSKNKGLANSVIAGVTKVINEYGKVIVVEDDIVTHKYFLHFMNDCLDTYERRQDIFMIGGFGRDLKLPRHYKNDIYLVHRSNSWGWATWKNRWEKADWNITDFDSMCRDESKQSLFNRGGHDMFPMLKAQMEGKIDSWAIRWDYCMYKNDAYCIHPVKTFNHNMGFDGTGVHCASLGNDIAASLYDGSYSVELPLNIKANHIIEREFQYFAVHNKHCPTFFEKISSSLSFRLLWIKSKLKH